MSESKEILKKKKRWHLSQGHRSHRAELSLARSGVIGSQPKDGDELLQKTSESISIINR